MSHGNGRIADFPYSDKEVLDIAKRFPTPFHLYHEDRLHYIIDSADRARAVYWELPLTLEFKKFGGHMNPWIGGHTPYTTIVPMRV